MNEFMHSLQGIQELLQNSFRTSIPFLKSKDGLVLLGSVAFLFFLSNSKKVNSKNKLATSRFGGKAEFSAARKLAREQMKGKKHNQVALQIGEPRKGLFGLDDSKTLYFPSVQRGVLAVGQPGSGKTYSALEPQIRSAIRQGFPILLYDFKYPDMAEGLAGYAALHNYKISVFAPGYEESSIVNILDFMKSHEDAETARQLAEVIMKNFSMGNKERGDNFFSEAGNQLVEAILMLAKDTTFPDIIMAHKLLSLENLPARLRIANLNPWVDASFSQLMSLTESEKTVASIVGTAIRFFTRFMKPKILNAFCGKTTLPLKLQGRQLVVIGMDRNLRDVMGPLIASTIHMIVIKNLMQKRKDPLIVALDELPTIYLPDLVKWLNELRSAGFIGLLGAQNIAQLEAAYGKEITRALRAAVATKFYFNPGDEESAEIFSKSLGDKQVDFSSKSRGTSAGKGSQNISDQHQARRLFEPAQFLRLETGSCIITGPGLKHNREVSIPVQQRIIIPEWEMRAVERSKEAYKRIRAKLIEKNSLSAITAEHLMLRKLKAEALYPAPEPEEAEEKY